MPNICCNLGIEPLENTNRVVPDTDFAGYPAAGYPAAGYPANNYAGYRISGYIVNIEFFLNFFSEIFSFQQTLPTFLGAISLLFIPSEKVLKKVCLFEVRINCLTGYPANETGFRISKKAGYPVQP